MENLKTIKEIFSKNISQVNEPNAFEIYFDININLIPEYVDSFEQKLFKTLLQNISETDFSHIYTKLSNSGLDSLEYLNHLLFDFTLNISDDRIKFWILIIAVEPKRINIMLWILQYKFKKDLLKIPKQISIEDIPNPKWGEISRTCTYHDFEDQSIASIFRKKERGITLL